MTELETGYRALPSRISHPKHAIRISRWKFLFSKKSKKQEAPSICEGHNRTIVWYSPPKGYIIEIQFSSFGTYYFESICTYTPTMGMDRIDGMFAEDIEAYYINRILGIDSPLLDIFREKEYVEIDAYLKVRGLTN